LEALPQALQFDIRQTCPGAACVDEVTLRSVVPEQQRPDPMPAALRVTPSHDHELFPIEALDLEPCAPVGLVLAVNAF
jgi:hypothetical protein